MDSSKNTLATATSLYIWINEESIHTAQFAVYDAVAREKALQFVSIAYSCSRLEAIASRLEAIAIRWHSGR